MASTAVCGERGEPLCFGSDALCGTLLQPAFPAMVCVDSMRDSEDSTDCGTLGSAPCSSDECSAPLVVHSDEDMCVPAQDAPCGATNEAQCFWDGKDACLEGLEAREGLCLSG